MTITLIFTLPDEQAEYDDARNGTKWKCVVEALREHLRAKLKYSDIPTKQRVIVAELLTTLHTICQDWDVSL